MKTQPSKTERLHALDSLRAIMMMLGIVLHSAITYIGGNPDPSWPTRDSATDSALMEWILYIIHNFRMPIFMVIAGFFASLLFFDRSPRRMIINRMQRILFPFVIFLILLWPLVTASFWFSNQVFGFADPLGATKSSQLFNAFAATFTDVSALIPGTTMHLWFLYYLVMFSLASYALAQLFKHFPVVTEKTTAILDVLLKRPLLKLVVSIALTFGLLVFMDRQWVATSLSFVPDLNTFVFYFFFYMCGWILFKSKHLLGTFLQYDWAFSILGTAIYTAYFLLETGSLATELHMLINATCVWLFIFGITGLFLRYFSGHSARMRYISDSSYWVYLLHLPLTALLPGVIGIWNVPAILKFSIVVLVTTFICFLTYHYLVRSTFIGKFLNGRKYSRKISDIKKAEVVAQLKPAMDK
jgi:peptidoglycan/LPS O-acetylase OafA/YrhL